MTHRRCIVRWLTVSLGVLKMMISHIHCHISLRAQITKRQNAQMNWKWPLGPLYRGWPNFSKCSNLHKNHPLANLTILDPFSGLNLTSDTPKIWYLTHLSASKMHLKILGTDVIEHLCSPIFFDILRFLKSFQFKFFMFSKFILEIVNSSQL